MRVVLDVVRGREPPRVVELDVPSFADARQRVQRDGYTVLGQRATISNWRHWSASEALPGGSSFSTAVFAEQFRDLLSAGLSVIEALTTLQRVATERDRAVLDELIAQLRAGQRLSDAMASLGRTFSPLLAALVRTSELTSDLPQALTRFLEHDRRVAELRHRLAAVAVYPLLLTVVGGGVLLFLLLYVMPRFARVFEGMAGELPWSARAMVAWSQWLTAHGTTLLILGALVTAVAVALATVPATRTGALQKLLALAPMRSRLRTYFLARWYRASGVLAFGGVALPKAVELANDVLPEGLRRAGEAVVRALHDGLSPTEAHVRAGMATPVAEQLMRAGERTGAMGEVLGRIAEFHDAEISRTLERQMRTLEPIVMVLIGLGVGVVVILMYLPIFELAAAIQ